MFLSNISTEKGIELVKLSSTLSDLAISIAVNIGNTLFSIKKNEKEYLYFPYLLNEYKNISQLAGNPFMHPWANRLEGDFILFNHEKKEFPNAQKKSLYRDANNLPLHGLLLKSDKWKTKAIINQSDSISHIAIFEFCEAEELAIFPFEHTIEMKTTLTENNVSIEILFINNSNQPMPLSSGFHPYFAINPTKKDDLKIEIPFANVILANESMIPNGDYLPKEMVFNGFNIHSISLGNNYFDHGFEGIIDFKKCTVNQLDRKFEVNFGDFPIGQIYAPNKMGKPYICIEPMLAKTNDLNRNNCEYLNPKSCIKKTFEIIIQ